MRTPSRRFLLTLSLSGLLLAASGIANASTDTDPGAGVVATAIPGPRTTTEVPLPPSVWLFLSGVGSLAVLKIVRTTRQHRDSRSDDPPAG